MCLVVDPGEVLKIQMSVNLRGADVGVAKQLLHSAQVTAGLQHVAGARVTKHVGMHGSAQTPDHGPAPDALLD